MHRIGKYEILSELGHGGMGVVYKGRDAIIDRHVAIKVIHDRALQDPSIKKRFYREAQSAGRLLWRASRSSEKTARRAV